MQKMVGPSLRPRPKDTFQMTNNDDFNNGNDRTVFPSIAYVWWGA